MDTGSGFKKQKKWASFYLVHAMMYVHSGITFFTTIAKYERTTFCKGVQIYKEFISDLKRENQFFSKERDILVFMTDL
jgi:hypothetical protein